MSESASQNFNHARKEVVGVLLTNLGTPGDPSTGSVRCYLKEFLGDSRVIEVPRLIWWLILNLFILNTRPKRSAKAYQKIWTDQGSPLMTISKQQAQALQVSIDDKRIRVELAMRYGQPSLAAGMQSLRDQGASRVLVFPLYPQYSATTTATTFDAVAKELRSWRRIPEMRFVNHYHDHPAYIGALAASIQAHWRERGRAEKLLMSFHGIPQEYFDKGDPYHCECLKTGRLLAEKLGLTEKEWQLSFQSRLGPKKWLSPYTDKTLEALGQAGVKSVQVVCPGFSVDCLETLEEIAMENRDVFLENGGKRYEYIPCLNAEVDHIAMMQAIIAEHTQGWQARDASEIELSQRQLRATKLGAKC